MSTLGPSAALGPRFARDGDREAERDGLARDTLALRGLDSLRSVDLALCKRAPTCYSLSRPFVSVDGALTLEGLATAGLVAAMASSAVFWRDRFAAAAVSMRGTLLDAPALDISVLVVVVVCVCGPGDKQNLKTVRHEDEDADRAVCAESGNLFRPGSITR